MLKLGVPGSPDGMLGDPYLDPPNLSSDTLFPPANGAHSPTGGGGMGGGSSLGGFDSMGGSGFG
eukprot:CAMPEP_0174947388 /NCGR_PEP_ID=MMETSP1355-20121228/86494_1 /TAXON_ID=464990 /ORGANISM="Hemiselmis tepida, Strain CCMP443" /LENGTH=63 /DNA_ID=CAMNT_0016194857 /DNA_START=210 /DNA_END=397 /DNA_ORIENTATION=+